MTVTIEQTRGTIRVEELLNPGMPEKFFEVIEGVLVVMTPAGRKHNRVAFNIAKIFDQFCEKNPTLDCTADNNCFLLQRDPDVLLSPDASLFRQGAISDDSPWYKFAPGIAVEVLSPSNNASQIAYKQNKYLAGGAEQVWIVNLEQESLTIHFQDGRRLFADGNECVAGEGIAAGLTINLRDVFTLTRGIIS